MATSGTTAITASPAIPGSISGVTTIVANTPPAGSSASGTTVITASASLYVFRMLVGGVWKNCTIKMRVGTWHNV